MQALAETNHQPACGWSIFCGEAWFLSWFKQDHAQRAVDIEEAVDDQVDIHMQIDGMVDVSDIPNDGGQQADMKDIIGKCRLEDIAPLLRENTWVQDGSTHLADDPRSWGSPVEYRCLLFFFLPHA